MLVLVDSASLSLSENREEPLDVFLFRNERSSLLVLSQARWGSEGELINNAASVGGVSGTKVTAGGLSISSATAS